MNLKHNKGYLFMAIIKKISTNDLQEVMTSRHRGPAESAMVLEKRNLKDAIHKNVHDESLCEILIYMVDKVYRSL